MDNKKKKLDFATIIVKKILDVSHINLTSKCEHLLIQIFKFGIVGVIATLIDFIFLFIFKEYCHFPVLLANTLSFIISVLYNYWASLTFVFDVNREKNKKKTFIIFIVCSVIGLLLNDIIVFIVTDILMVYYLLSKVIATIFVMIFNFVTRKKFLE